MNRRACVYALATGAGLLFGPMTAEKALAEPFRASGSLQIAVAAQSASAANPTLDVTFKGGNVHSIELYLDGILVNKQAINTRDGRGVISFSLDGATDGSHSVLVKAFDADGNCATTTAQWKITAQNEDVLARFTGVKQNAQIQGVFPLQIAIDSSVHNPYVTFKIDNDFLAFTNYAPYSYNWDTTKADNGAHTIGVEVLDGESLRTVQTLSLSVNVNNPGGYTRIHTDKMPATAPFKPNTPANDMTRIAAQAGQPNVRMEPSAANTLSHLGMKFAAPALRTGAAPKSGAISITRNNTRPATRSNAPPNPLAPEFVAGSPLRNGVMAPRPAELRAGTPNNLRPDAQTAAPTIGDVLDANLRPSALRHTDAAPPSRSAEPNRASHRRQHCAREIRRESGSQHGSRHDWRTRRARVPVPFRGADDACRRPVPRSGSRPRRRKCRGPSGICAEPGIRNRRQHDDAGDSPRDAGGENNSSCRGCKNGAEKTQSANVRRI